MKSLNYLRWPLLLLFFGIFLWFTAGLIKIRHWSFAGELFLIAWLVIAIGILFGMIKLLFLKKERQY